MQIYIYKYNNCCIKILSKTSNRDIHIDLTINVLPMLLVSLMM